MSQGKIDKKSIVDKIKIARDAVKNEEEPYKTEAFKIIFSRLLDSDGSPTATSVNTKPASSKIVHKKVDTDTEKGKDELAKKCGIKTDELNDVISIKDDVIEILSIPDKISNEKKQLISAQCVLLTYEIMMNQEWTNTSVLKNCVDKSGVGTNNFSRTMNDNKSLIKSRGELSGTEYKLSGPGRKNAAGLIRKLAKGEEIAKT